MSNAVRNGTVNESGDSLCMSCRSGMIVHGRMASEDRTYCRALNNTTAVPMRFVSLCSAYDDKRVPSRWDMEQIAWVLMTDLGGRKIGFVSPQEAADRQRNVPVGPPPRG